MTKSRIGSYFILAAMLLLLVWGSIALFPHVNSSRSSAIAEGKNPAIKIAWKTLASGVRFLGFSANGKYSYTTTPDGNARIYKTSDGSSRIIKLPEGTNRICISPDGKFVLAYAYLNPSLSKLTFLSESGDTIWETEISGAVWCADACSHDKDARFVVGTGESYIYVLDVGKTRRKYKRWRTPGVVVSLYLDPKGEVITAGTWQKSAVARYSIDGRHMWEISADSGSLQYLEPLRYSNRVVVSSLPNRADADGMCIVFDGRGNRRWQAKLESSQKAKILSSSNGKWICVSYEKMISHKGESMREKHSMLYDSSGRVLWDKGSSFFQSEPILVTSSGYALLCHGDNALFTMQPQGELVQSIKLPASIEQSIASRDGAHALLKCADGKLYLLNIRR